MRRWMWRRRLIVRGQEVIDNTGSLSTPRLWDKARPSNVSTLWLQHNVTVLKMNTGLRGLRQDRGNVNTCTNLRSYRNTLSRPFREYWRSKMKLTEPQVSEKRTSWCLTALCSVSYKIFYLLWPRFRFQWVFAQKTLCALSSSATLNSGPQRQVPPNSSIIVIG